MYAYILIQRCCDKLKALLDKTDQEGSVNFGSPQQNLALQFHSSHKRSLGAETYNDMSLLVHLHSKVLGIPISIHHTPIQFSALTKTQGEELTHLTIYCQIAHTCLFIGPMTSSMTNHPFFLSFLHLSVQHLVTIV